MDVCLNANIARLVLGYLNEEDLQKVSEKFCKYSPYLNDEYNIIKKGFRPISTNGENLLTIVREYCYIKSRVNQVVRTFPENISAAFEMQSLAGKINYLLKLVKASLNVGDTSRNTSKVSENRSAGKLKRRRTRSESSSVSPSPSMEATRMEDLPGYRPSMAKKPRMSNSYFFLQNVHSEDSESENENDVQESGHVSAIIADKILENQEFQTKLVENINKVLQTSTQPTHSETNIVDQEQRTSDEQFLDQMIENIMQATERDPSFDEVIQNVASTSVLSSVKKQTNKTSRTIQIDSNLATPSFFLNQTINSSKQNTISSEINKPEFVLSNIPQIPTEPPVVIDTPQPKSSIIFKAVTNAAINETNLSDVTSTPTSIDPNLSISKIILMNSNNNEIDPMLASTSNNTINFQNYSPYQGEPIYLDTNTGQTFPILMTNDGCIYINNSYNIGDVTNQANQPTTATEQIPLENNYLNNDLTSQQVPVVYPQDIHLETIENNNNNNDKQPTPVIEKSVIIPLSLDSRIEKGRETPHCSNVANFLISKSLSTPRRKSSHVRVLQFSPLSKIIENEAANKNIENVQITEQIIPNIQTTIPQSNLVTINNSVENDICSNSNSNSTDITGGDQSNLTVIQRRTSLHIDTPKRHNIDLRSCKRNLSRSNSEEDIKIDKLKSGIKKKSVQRKKLLLARKRKIISEANKKLMSPIKKIKKKTPIKEKQNEKLVKDDNENSNLLDEWNKMREKSKRSDFDQHLREVASKTPIIVRQVKKRRVRRKIGANKSKNKIETDTMNTDIEDDNSPDISQENESKQCQSVSSDTLQNPSTSKDTKLVKEKKCKNIETKTSFLNFRIKTPIKDSPKKNEKMPKIADKTKEGGKNKSLRSKMQNYIEKTYKKPKSKTKNKKIELPKKVELKDNSNLNKKNVLPIETEKCTKVAPPVFTINIKGTNNTTPYPNLDKEMEKRTNNIAHLLETPFKTDAVSEFPATPGVLQNVNLSDKKNDIDNATPITKLMAAAFSALKHSELRTPAFAITPGGNLTLSTDKETPKSGGFSIPTDYSSGGSYYRPDESEDVDKLLDKSLNTQLQRKNLRNQKQRKSQPENASTTTTSTKIIYPLQQSSTKLNQNENIQIKTPDNIKESENLNKKNIEAEIEEGEIVEENEEKIGVTEIVPCPVILKKVKSFSEETPSVMPHYKFMDAGLPDLTDESSTSSSSSSTCNSSCSNSSSSSQSTTSSNDSKKEIRTNDDKPIPLSPLLSTIDSSEDNDWEIHSETKGKVDEENSQLVSTEGEVRFPVRSWITPQKSHEKTIPLKNCQSPEKNYQLPPSSRISIPNNSMMPIYEDRFKQKSELESKLERVKAKLTGPTGVPSTSHLAPVIAKIDLPSNVKVEKKDLANKNCEKTPDKPSNQNQIEVLTALNLSAKKKNISEEEPKTALPTQIDDNATSDVFSLGMEDGSSVLSSNPSLDIRNAALTLTTMSMQQRKLTCEIEPQPMKVAGKKRGRPPLTKKDPVIAENIIAEPVKLRKGKTLPMPKKKSELLTNSTVTSKRKTEDIKLPEKEIIKPLKKELTKEKVQNKKTQKEKTETKKQPKRKSNEKDKVSPSTSKDQTEIIKPTIDNLEIHLSENDNDKINTEKIITAETQNDSYKSQIEDNNKNNSEKDNNNISKNESESEEEDVYDQCILVSANENAKNFKEFVYLGPNKFETPKRPTFDFKQAMVDFQLDDVIHRLQCCNQFTLFEAKPINNEKQNVETIKSFKSSKTVSKRRDRNIKCIPISRDNSIKPMVSVPNDLIKLDDGPQYTSTPCQPKFKIIHKNKFSENPNYKMEEKEKKKENLKNISGESSKSNRTNDKSSSSGTIASEIGSPTNSSQESVSKQNIRNEDINAVLSHLYGNGK